MSRDADGWAALGGAEGSASEDDDSDKQVDNVGPVQLEGNEYTYQLANGSSITVQQDVQKGLSFQIWPSALTLAQHAEARNTHQPGYWKGKLVVELGSGCGLVGLVFAALGANVLLTDLPHVLEHIRENIDMNEEVIQDAGGCAIAASLVWGKTNIDWTGRWAQPDFVVAADVVYQQQLFEPLLETVSAYPAKTKVLLAHVRRWKSDKRFFAAARKLFTLTDLSDAAEATSPHTKGALKLFELEHKPSNK